MNTKVVGEGVPYAGVSVLRVMETELPGVGWLVRLAAWVGREAHPRLKLGICGEHGGDPDSIEFFHEAGLDYVSCSPFRVPIARIAAARAQIASPRSDMIGFERL